MLEGNTLQKKLWVTTEDLFRTYDLFTRAPNSVIRHNRRTRKRKAVDEDFLCFCFMKSCRRWSPAPTSLLLLPRPAVGVPRVQELTVHSGVPRVQELTVHSDESLRAVEGSPLRWNIARFKCFAYCQEAHVSSFCLSGSFDCSFSFLLKISWN